MSKSLEGQVLALEAMLTALMRRVQHHLPAGAMDDIEAEAVSFVESIQVDDEVRKTARQSVGGIFASIDI